ncbi:MAG: hypothetical protein ACFFDI_31965 [Promethearchaeota archaeon]
MSVLLKKIEDTFFRPEREYLRDLYLLIALALLGYFVRLWMALTTFGVVFPDEFMYIEVAHDMKYGFGIIPWELQVPNPGEDGAAKSYFYVLVYFLIMEFTDFMGWNYFTVTLPLIRLFDMTISALVVPTLYLMAKELTDSRPVAIIATFFATFYYFLVKLSLHSFTDNLSTPFIYFFVFIVIYLQKKDLKSRSLNHYILAFIGGLSFGIAFMIRSFSIGAPLPILLLRFHWKDVKIYGSSALGLLLLVFFQGMLDLYYYGQFLISPYNLFKYNIIDDKARIHGSAPWGWYFERLFTESPLLLTFTILFVAFLCLEARALFISAVEGKIQQNSIKKRIKEFLQQVHLVLWVFSYIFIYSFQAHKQLRFIYPVIPVFIICFAWGVWRAANDIPEWLLQGLNTLEQYQLKFNFHRHRNLLRSLAFLIIIAISLNAFYFLNLYESNRMDWNYNGDVVKSMEFVGQQDSVTGVIVLAQFGYTGTYTHLHRNVSLLHLGGDINFYPTRYSTGYNWLICPKYRYYLDEGLQARLNSSSFEFVITIDELCDVYHRPS